MNSLLRHLLPGRRLLSATLLAHLLVVTLLAASPQAHRWLHGDADAADHDCAIVLFAHGQADQVAGPVVVPGFVVQTVALAPLALAAEAFVPPVGATGAASERGPPTLG